MKALRAFEAAARHSSYTRAAEELAIQQPAVSRYIAELEHDIGVRLFERFGREVRLTPAGEVFRHAVTIGLERIAAGALSAVGLAEDQGVIVACGHAISHQFLMPRFATIRSALGEDISLRILTLDYGMLNRLDEREFDVLISHDAVGEPESWVEMFRQAVTPVCSPGFAETHAQVLARPVAEWDCLPFLGLVRPAQGWTTWRDWFEAAGCPLLQPRYVGFEDYVYLIEAAVDGQGLALGLRHFIDRYINAGTLVAVVDGFSEFDRSCFASLTTRGRQRPAARRCLDILGTLTNDTAYANRPTQGSTAMC